MIKYEYATRKQFGFLFIKNKQLEEMVEFQQALIMELNDRLLMLEEKNDNNKKEK